MIGIIILLVLVTHTAYSMVVLTGSAGGGASSKSTGVFGVNTGVKHRCFWCSHKKHRCLAIPGIFVNYVRPKFPTVKRSAILGFNVKLSQFLYWSSFCPPHQRKVYYVQVFKYQRLASRYDALLFTLS